MLRIIIIYLIVFIVGCANYENNNDYSSILNLTLDFHFHINYNVCSFSTYEYDLNDSLLEFNSNPCKNIAKENFRMYEINIINNNVIVFHNDDMLNTVKNKFPSLFGYFENNYDTINILTKDFDYRNKSLFNSFEIYSKNVGINTNCCKVLVSSLYISDIEDKAAIAIKSCIYPSWGIFYFEKVKNKWLMKYIEAVN